MTLNKWATRGGSKLKKWLLILNRVSYLVNFLRKLRFIAAVPTTIGATRRWLFNTANIGDWTKNHVVKVLLSFLRIHLAVSLFGYSYCERRSKHISKSTRRFNFDKMWIYQIYNSFFVCWCGSACSITLSSFFVVKKKLKSYSQQLAPVVNCGWISEISPPPCVLNLVDNSKCDLAQIETFNRNVQKCEFYFYQLWNW